MDIPYEVISCFRRGTCCRRKSDIKQATDSWKCRQDKVETKCLQNFCCRNFWETATRKNAKEMGGYIKMDLGETYSVVGK
jgi:hypothetical protein